MNKTAFLIILLIGLCIGVYFFTSTTKESKIEKTLSKKSSQTESLNLHDEKTAETDKPEIVSESNIDESFGELTNEQIIGYAKKCGFDAMSSKVENLIESNFNTQDFTETQLHAFEKLKNNETCQQWYETVELIPDEEKEKINQTFELNNQKTLDFATGSNTVLKLEIARNVLSGESNEISRALAISYLLGNDVDLMKKISVDVGTENESLVAHAARDIIKIYSCQNDYSQCSSDSQEMILKCVFRADYCDMDYFAFLDYTRTPNEVSDLYNMTDALRRIINQGYPNL